MIIAFSTNMNADSAGMHLTKLFSNWVEEMTDEGRRIEIVNVNSSAGKNGWMMIVQYRILEEGEKK